MLSTGFPSISNGGKYELKILAFILLLSLVVGVIAENMLLFPLLGLLTYLVWHLYRLTYLTRLLRQRKRVHPPYPPGLWGEIHRLVEHTQAVERKRKKRLARFIHQSRIVASSIPDGLVLLDKNQRIDWANPVANTLLNISYPRDEGERILDLLHYPFLGEYLLAADFTRPMEFPSPDYSGLVISLQFIPFKEKKRRRLLLIARDITQAFNMNQIRKDFVANVSHELRTPLTVIRGFIENLNFTAKYPEQERPLMLMQQHAIRMESAIDDLLSLSQLEFTQENRIKKLVPIASLLMELIEEARNLSGNQNHTFLSDIDPNLGLLGIEPELRIAFSNLIFNAVRHTPRRAEIKILWKFENQKARFIVRDSGEGIAARHIPRLTEHFYRVDPGRSRQSGGTGLGLTIVKHSVSRHGGSLEIQSKVGMGSTFRCEFPTGAFCYLASPDTEDGVSQPHVSQVLK